MRKTNSLFFRLIVMLIALAAVPVNGQGLSGNDLSRVKASDVSDAQLTTITERGEKEGLSPQQALEMARARGMSASVANELLQRAEQLMARQESENAAVSALRTNGEPLAPLQASAPEDSIPTLPEEEEGPQIFGKSLFAKKHQGFEPAMNVPTPVNYVLGPGDELVVDIWGATTNLHQLTVSTEGTVGIDNLGPIYVQGLTMQQAEERMFSKLFNTVSGKKIAILGWAFKKDTNDTRESAAIYVADYLLNEQAELWVYDPKVKAEQVYADLDYLNTRSEAENRRLVKVVNDPYEAMNDAHAVAILTEWDEFKTYDWQKVYEGMKKPAFLFDGRNVVNGNKTEVLGFSCEPIGG